MNSKLLLLAAQLIKQASREASASAAYNTIEELAFAGLLNQRLETPFYGQHVGVTIADLNGDGAQDLLFAAGRHWIDQSYVLVNLGPEFEGEGEDRKFRGVRFSDALPIGPPGGYYQVDVSEHSTDDNFLHRSTVLLVGGTCQIERSNNFGSCNNEENTPARVVEVIMASGGCSIHNPDAECHLNYNVIWEHPNPKGDRNGGFATFNGHEVIILLGQGGIEIFKSPNPSELEHDSLIRTRYSPVYHHSPPAKTNPKSDYARYAGFAAGNHPNLGGLIAAGRRTDYDTPQKDEDGNIKGINKIFWKRNGAFHVSTLPSSVSGEPYPNMTEAKYSIQTTNFCFADMNGDGVPDLLEATYLYPDQIEPNHQLPQRLHLLDEKAHVKETIELLLVGDKDAGRSVTTGKIFSDSALPDAVFASAKGVVTLFANLGVDENEKLTLEQRYQLPVGTQDCQVRDVAIVNLAQDAEKCWIGIICAITCGIEILGRNHIFFVEGDGAACSDGHVTLSVENVRPESRFD